MSQLRTMVLGICICNVPAPTTPAGFETWAVASQRSNQFSQRVRPAGEKLAGRLDCHIPPFPNGTRHPCLATRHFHQAREKHDNQSALSELSMRWACPGLRTSPQCNVPAPTTPAGFETWADSTLRVASQRSNQLSQRVRPAGEKLAGRLDCHILNGPCRVL